MEAERFHQEMIYSCLTKASGFVCHTAIFQWFILLSLFFGWYEIGYFSDVNGSIFMHNRPVYNASACILCKLIALMHMDEG